MIVLCKFIRWMKKRGTKGLVKVKESAGIRPDGMRWLG